MRGPCAKAVVECMIHSPDGETYWGENDCAKPQKVCPRQPNEDYLKCVVICKQAGHAEMVALQKAGDKAKGAEVTIEGIDYVCKDCQKRLFAAGVDSITIWRPSERVD